MEKFTNEKKLFELLNQKTPVETYEGYLIKRDDYFNLNGIYGGKVRQCLKLVYDNLDHIKKHCNNTIITAAGLPSPQSVIVSCVANYFDLNCRVVVPRYKNSIKDFNRINVSLAQKFGAKIYGVGNPNPIGPENDVRLQCRDNNFFQIKFGMNGEVVTNTNAEQVSNIPDNLKSITVISGSGLSAIAILKGIEKFNKKVDCVNVICLSNYFEKNCKMWYNWYTNKKQNINIISSRIPYQKLFKYNNTFDFDLTWLFSGLKIIYNQVKIIYFGVLVLETMI